MRSRRARRLAAAVGLAAALLACGEPAVGVELPSRRDDQQVLDLAGVLDDGVERRLSQMRAELGVDVVAFTFEDERASLGQADRGGRLVLGEWGADVVLVAVARPGDFTNPDPSARRRFFGVNAEDRFAVGRDLRERVVEEAVPPPASDNDWTRAFHAAIDVIDEHLRREG